MLGGAASFMFFMLVLFVLSIWILVRIWRRSPLLAILSFLFWPVTIFALISCWGDEESDIRVPFFASLVVGALMLFSAYRTVDQGVQEMAVQLSDEEIARIRSENPELALALEQARAEQGGEVEEVVDDVDQAVHDARAGRPRDHSAERETPPPAPRDPAQIESARRVELQQLAANLSWRLGRVEFANAASTLRLPSEFRFATRDDLSRLARVRNTPIAEDVLGWIVHRDVNLARDDAWYVRVRYRPLPAPLPPPQWPAGATATEVALHNGAFVQRVAAALDGEAATAHDGRWEPDTALARWERDGANAARREQVAARVLARGVLEFSVSDLHPVHAELGRRSAALIALRTVPNASALAATR
jgi:hypothetical protein